MQASVQKQTVEVPNHPGSARPPLGGRAAVEENLGRRRFCYAVPSSSPRQTAPMCTCSSHPGSAQCRRHGYLLPSQKVMRRNYAGNKEILRRALAPPSRRLTLRWVNFRPAPSRLSNMSLAS